MKFQNLFNNVSVIDLYITSKDQALLPHTIKPLKTSYKIFGKVLTVNCPAGDNYYLHHAIYKAEEGQIIIADTNGLQEAGYWGEIMSTAAKQKRIGGLIINGCVRDHLQLLELDFPIFCTGICAKQTTKDKIKEGEIGSSIKIGSVSIHPGNYAAADCNGITILHEDELNNAFDEALIRIKNEEEIIKSILNSKRTIDIFNIA